MESSSQQLWNSSLVIHLKIKGVSAEINPLPFSLGPPLPLIDLPIPTRSTYFHLFFGASVRYDALLNFKGLNDVFPRLEIKVKNRLVL